MCSDIKHMHTPPCSYIRKQRSFDMSATRWQATINEAPGVCEPERTSARAGPQNWRSNSRPGVLPSKMFSHHLDIYPGILSGNRCEILLPVNHGELHVG